MKPIKLWLIIGALLTMSLPASAGVLFTLNPATGQVTGQAGTAVGWGYTITVDDSTFVSIQSITFGDSTPIGVFSTPGVPLQTAFLGAPIIVPWIQDISGLQYDISPAAILNASTSGLMTLTFDTFTDLDQTNQIGFGDTVNAFFGAGDVLAQVTVDQEAVSNPAPEPGSLVLFGIGATVIGIVRRRFV
jgi:hypothetical protein